MILQAILLRTAGCLAGGVLRSPALTLPEDTRHREWAGTCEALHLWIQIVGKVRLAQTPWLNHSWQAPLYVTSRGLTTGPVPHGRRYFDMEFDFVGHVLRLRSDADAIALPLRPMAVAEFYAQVMGALDALKTPALIFAAPTEMADSVPFGGTQACGPMIANTHIGSGGCFCGPIAS